MKDIIYNGGDEFIIHRDYVAQFLKENQELIDDEETYNYVVKNDNYLLAQIAEMNDEYIGLSIHPMDDCLFINQSLLEEIEEE